MTVADQKTGPSTGQPLVSVILPAFNAERTLAETLKSVAAQSYRHLEIIIVDDGSIDGTSAIADAFCREDHRGRLLQRANGGVAAARNSGLAAAAGEWVAMMDSDDLWHPSKIEKQVAAALSAPEPPGFVYCWFRTIDGEGRVTGSGENHHVNGPALQRLLYVNFVGNGSAPLYARSALLATGGFEESLQAKGAHGCDDALMQLRVARAGPVAVVPEFLVGYRHTPGSISADTERMFRSWGLASALFRGEAKDLPERVIGWNLGRRCLGLAEHRAHDGHYRGSLSLLAKAIRLDPARNLRILLYRTARLARKILVKPADIVPPAFLALDTRHPWNGDRHSIPVLAARLDRFEQRRMERLAAADRRATLAKQGRSQ